MTRTVILAPAGVAMTDWLTGALHTVAEALEAGMIDTAKPARSKLPNL
jgi:hypothetical protein